MALAEELLVQARQMVTRERKNPRQASLRRAISAAYYALFHLLLNEASLQAAGGGPPGLRYRIARTAEHHAMKGVCERFCGGKTPLPQKIKRLCGPIPPEIQQVALAFANLQAERHDADYDTEMSVLKSHALAQVQTAELAFKAWTKVRKSPEASVFLAALLFPKNFDR